MKAQRFKRLPVACKANRHGENAVTVLGYVFAGLACTPTINFNKRRPIQGRWNITHVNTGLRIGNAMHTLRRAKHALLAIANLYTWDAITCVEDVQTKIPATIPKQSTLRVNLVAAHGDAWRIELAKIRLGVNDDATQDHKS